MIGSPTRERAQCFTLNASARRSGWTPSGEERDEERSKVQDVCTTQIINMQKRIEIVLRRMNYEKLKVYRRKSTVLR